MTKPLVMIGAGGHAAVLAEILLEQNRQLIAVVSPDLIKENSPLFGVAQIASDEEFLTIYSPQDVELVNGVGSIPRNNIRSKLSTFFTGKGYSFARVISKKAILSNFLTLGEGVQIMPGAVIQVNTVIGKNSIINTGAIVEHDCIIGANNHIAPGVTLSGGVMTDSDVHVGTGANIIQGIHIGQAAVVGAGTTISRNVPDGQILIPARSRIID
tara:strand:- start:16691 stop:17329 length:639 start_codon:yes stop_codon:yes gene_type:complete